MSVEYIASEQVKGIPLSATLKVNEKIAELRGQGKTVCHMGFGESPFPVHPYIADALAKAVNFNQYPAAKGLLELRQAAENYFAPRLGFNTSNTDIIVAPGSKDIIFATQLAIKGDLVLPTPSWVSYAPQAQLAGTNAIKIPTKANNHHKLTGEMLRDTIIKARSDGFNPTKIILNYPNNPTGLGFDKTDLQEIADVCRQEGIIVISDEIYGLVSHGQKHTSIASFYPEGTVVTTGLSKHLSLGGYRVGFGFIPNSLKGLSSDVTAIASETWSCVSHPIQHAAVAALEARPEVEEHVSLSTKAHGLASNYVRDRLIAMGLDYPPLVGGFYLFPNFTPFAKKLEAAYGVKTNFDLADDLLDRCSLATLPGTDFGDEPEVLTLRIAITDYNGDEALKYLRKNPNATSEDLVSNACPLVKQACDIMASYLENA